MKRVIQALREGKLFDYISNNGHNYSKEELCNIIKELDFAIYDKGRDIKEDIWNNASEELSERYQYLESEEE